MVKMTMTMAMVEMTMAIEKMTMTTAMVEMMTMKLMTKVMGNDEGYSYNHTTLPIQVLYLSTNSLLEIPHKLPKHLEHLTLDNNQISQLPKGSLSRTQRLRRLMLQRNKIGMTKRYVCVKLKIPPPPPPSPSPPPPPQPVPPHTTSSVAIVVVPRGHLAQRRPRHHTRSLWIERVRQRSRSKASIFAHTKILCNKVYLGVIWIYIMKGEVQC